MPTPKSLQNHTTAHHLKKKKTKNLATNHAQEPCSAGRSQQLNSKPFQKKTARIVMFDNELYAWRFLEAEL
jgi:hypothetical protein